jgi:hypothetical protein
MGNKKIHIRIRPDDLARVQVIRDAYGVSMAGAIRAALKAMCQQLGIDPSLKEK